MRDPFFTSKWLLGVSLFAAIGAGWIGHRQAQIVSSSLTSDSSRHSSTAALDVTRTYSMNFAGGSKDVAVITLAAFRGVGNQPAAFVAKAHPTVTLPLYPGATPRAVQFQLWNMGTPNTPYTLTGNAKYDLPVPPTQARAWFADALQRAGLTKAGSGSAGNRKTGIFAYGDSFQKPGSTHLEVSTSFLAGANGTLFAYTVSEIAVPPRPLSSYMPTDVTSIRVRYKPWGYHSPLQEKDRNISSTNDIQQLEHALNRLHRSAGGIRHCAMDTGQGAVLTFLTRSRAAIIVKIDPACWSVNVNGVALDDQTHGLWDTLTSLMG